MPKYVEDCSDASDAANSFINLGLIDNYEGGVWLNKPSFQLNSVGLKLYSILDRNIGLKFMTFREC